MALKHRTFVLTFQSGVCAGQQPVSRDSWTAIRDWLWLNYRGFPTWIYVARSTPLKTVVAADKASSEWFGMPEAAIGRDDAVDQVLPVGEIPALLISLTSMIQGADEAGY